MFLIFVPFKKTLISRKQEGQALIFLKNATFRHKSKQCVGYFLTKNFKILNYVNV